jgi:hypothetical protein
MAILLMVISGVVLIMAIGGSFMFNYHKILVIIGGYF